MSDLRLLSCSQIEIKCLLENMSRNVKIKHFHRIKVNRTYRYQANAISYMHTPPKFWLQNSDRIRGHILEIFFSGHSQNSVNLAKECYRHVIRIQDKCEKIYF